MYSIVNTVEMHEYNRCSSDYVQKMINNTHIHI